MKKVFVADTGKEFQDQIQALCPPDKAGCQFFTSSMDVLSKLKKDKPDLIFLDLGLDDLNEFVMHDLLKKTGVTMSIPLLVMYSKELEVQLDRYEKLQYKAEGYHKKPVSDNDLKELLNNYLHLDGDALPDIGPEEDLPSPVIEDEFSDENLDRLVRGEFVDVNTSEPANDSTRDTRESTNPFGPDESSSRLDSPAEADIDLGFDEHIDKSMLDAPVFDDADEADEAPAPKTGKGRANKELETQLVSLERQKEMVAAENKELKKKLEKLQKEHKTTATDMKAARQQIENLKSALETERSQSGEISGELEKQKVDLATQMEVITREKIELEARFNEQQAQSQKESETMANLEKRLAEKDTQLKNLQAKLTKSTENQGQHLQQIEQEKEQLQAKIDEVSNRLTDKERELVAMNHEFEKGLQQKSEELVQQTEERMNLKFKATEESLNNRIQQLNDQTAQAETGLRGEIDTLTQTNRQLSGEIQDLKQQEETLNRTVSTLAGEKVSLSEKITALEEENNGFQQEMEQKEENHQQVLEQLGRQLQKSQEQLNFYRTKVEALTVILQKAVSLTQEGPEES